MKPKAEVMKDLARVRRRTIVIQKLTVTYNDIGEPIQEWTNWKTLKAERSDLWGDEYYAARVVGEESTIVFTLRYVPFLDQLDSVGYRILFESKVYDIKKVDMLRDDGMWVKIRALRREADG